MISSKIITITRLSNQILPVQPPNYNEYLRGKLNLTMFKIIHPIL